MLLDRFPEHKRRAQSVTPVALVSEMKVVDMYIPDSL